MHSPSEPRARWYPAALVSLALVGALSTYDNGTTQFGGFDFSLLVDLPFRLSQGQRPYLDFVTTMPPYFAVETSLAFKILGPAWASLVIVSVLQCVLVTLATGIYARIAGLTDAVALFLAAALSGAFCVYYGFPWHSVEGLIFSSLLLLAAIAWHKAPGFVAGAGLFLFSAALAWSKPNAVIFSVPTVLTVLWFSKDRMRALLTCAAGVLVMLVICMANGFVPTSVIESYLSVAGRAFSLDAIEDLQLFNFSRTKLDGTWLGLALPSVLLVVTAREARRAGSQALLPWVVALGSITSALYSALSNIESTTPAFAAATCGVTCAAALHTESIGEAKNVRRLVPLVAAALCLMAAFAFVRGASRERVRAMGPYFYQPPEQGELLTATRGFFAGTAVGQGLVQALIESETARCAFGTPVFYGPSLQWLYAATGQPSPKGVSIWWHPGSSHSRARNDELLEKELSASYAVRLHIQGDYPYYPVPLVERLKSAHTIIPLGLTQAMVPRDKASTVNPAKIAECSRAAVQAVESLFR